MVRNYKRVEVHQRNGKAYLPYHHYGKENLRKAIEEVKNSRMGCRQAARSFNVPVTTLRAHLNRESTIGSSVDKKRLFSEENEQHLVDCVNLLHDWKFPFSQLDLRYLAKTYLDAIGTERSQYSIGLDLPGVDWATAFVSRQKSKLSGALYRCSYYNGNVSEGMIERFLSNAQKMLMHVDADQILVYDETNLTNDPASEELAFKRGYRYHKHITSKSKLAFNVVYTGSATGDLLAPFAIYKGTRVKDSWTIGGPAGTVYGCSEYGWLNSKCFEKWFFNIVVPYFEPYGTDTKKVILCEYLSAHFTVAVLQKCQKLNIRFLCFPGSPHSRVINPAHLSFYYPTRKVWSEQLVREIVTTGGDGAVLSKKEFPRVFSQLYTTLTNCGKRYNVDLVDNFADTGLYRFKYGLIKKILATQKSDAIIEKGTIEDCYFGGNALNPQQLIIKCEPVDGSDNVEFLNENDPASDGESNSSLCMDVDEVPEEKDPLTEDDSSMFSEDNSRTASLESADLSREMDSSSGTEESTENGDTKELSDVPDNDIKESIEKIIIQVEPSIKDNTDEDIILSYVRHVNDTTESPSIASASTSVDVQIPNSADYRRKYTHLIKAYRVKCKEVRQLKACLNFYLNKNK